MAAPSSASSSHLWYVQVSGQVWGPYTEARMAAFLAEGRIAAATPVSPWSSGPFFPASETAEFADLLKPSASPAPQPAPSRPSQAFRSVESFQPVETARPVEFAEPPSQPGGAVRPLLVWAFLTSIAPSAFEVALGAHGPCVAIRTGLWLVQARTGAGPLRNALSRRLRAGDTLLVVEAPLEHAAWFNLDQVSEHDLRRLWIA